MTDNNDDDADQDRIVRKENKHGIPKDYVRVDMGTAVLEVPRRIRNPLTDRRHDLTKLSDDGYLKPFLALQYRASSPDVVDLGSSPVLTFDTDRWGLRESDGQHVLVKRDPESEFDAAVLNENAEDSV